MLKFVSLKFHRDATLSSLVCAYIYSISYLHLSCSVVSIFPATILCTICHVKLLLSYCILVVRQTVLSTPGYKLVRKKKKNLLHPLYVLVDLHQQTLFFCLQQLQMLCRSVKLTEVD